jgi:hypothetical protein
MNTLEKEFVPYEEALVLKELGFDEPCFGSWETEYAKVPTYTHSCSQFYKNSNHPKGKVTAPTFSQAFRWFREKCGYDIHIRGTIFRASYVIGIPKEIYIESVDEYPVVISWDYIIDETGKRKTYEEAELACLRKLIEIVKQNQ